VVHLPGQTPAYTLAFRHAPGECGSLFAEVLNGFGRVFGFRSINADQAHTLAVFHHQRVAIDYTLHNTVITVGRSSTVGNATAKQVKKCGKKESDD
jgi:hypothetical protein